ncbi:MAG: M17 family peptidase N-terminal domain-containing protein, partial [Bryobacteraceae bacterium]
MEIKLERKPIEQVEADAVIIPVFDKEGGGFSGEAAAAANRLTGGWIEELYANGEFSGKPFETAILHRPAGMKAKRLVLAGAGKREKFTDAVLRNVAGAALRALRPKGAKSLAIALDAGEGIEERAAALVEGA